MNDLKQNLDLAVQLVTVLGIVLALMQYRSNSLKEQRDKDVAAYLGTNDRYLEFLNACLAHPQADAFDIPWSESAGKQRLISREELILFTIFLSICERAVFLYRDANTELKRRQLAGWEEMLTNYAKREKFREAWSIVGREWDTAFKHYVDKRIEAALSESTPTDGLASS